MAPAEVAAVGSSPPVRSDEARRQLASRPGPIVTGARGQRYGPVTDVPDVPICAAPVTTRFVLACRSVGGSGGGPRPNRPTPPST